MILIWNFLMAIIFSTNQNICISSDCYIERQAKESANDRNDRAIRVCCWWYNQHFSSMNQKVILLTNDFKNREKAREMELTAFTGTF